MPVAVLKLPFLIQESIYKEMNHTQLIVLSFSSLRMRRMIELLNLKSPNFKYESMTSIVRCVVSSHNGTDKVLVMKKVYNLLKKDTQEISLNGFKFNVGFSSQLNSKGDICYIIDIPELVGKIEHALHHHIISLFRVSGRNLLTVSSDLSRVSSFRNVTDINIRSEKIDLKELEDYLIKNLNLHSVKIKAVIDGEISEDSKIWNIERLSIRNQNVGTFLRRFTGQHLQLHAAPPKTSDTSDMIHLLKEWSTNRGYHNLKTMIIYTGLRGFGCGLNYNEIMDRFELEQYQPANALRRPAHIQYNPQIIGEIPFNIAIRNYNFYEMRRSDEKRAFLKIATDGVIFLVYDEPE